MGFETPFSPVLTTLGTRVASLLGGSVVVEKVFAWPGICAYATDALLSGDFAPVQGFIVLVAVVYLLFNLLVDILAGVADPRISMG
ncbi:ABC transporter permease subunit [Xylophilus sp.]|uniref:ABC transporter permease subunit n=1 Tax=Xylophilus sp. TaxID=2653893 RepID=UPI002D811101|nr:ABC transporter permease subunit [Xylophilus sp.]